MRRIALTAAALAVGAGCSTVTPPAAISVMDGASAVPGSGTGTASPFSFSTGRAAQTFAAPATAVQPAVLSAMDDLRIQSVRQISDGGAIVLEGTTADNRRASATIRPHSRNSTLLTARIGLFGDEALSRALMDRVAIRLGALPPAAIPVEPPSTPGGNPYFSRAAVPDAQMLQGVAEAPYRDSPVR